MLEVITHYLQFYYLYIIVLGKSKHVGTDVLGHIVTRAQIYDL